MDFLIGGLAAMGATFFSNPLDVLKTRIQLQGELKPRGQHEIHYRHALHAAYVVIKQEGIFALQKGLGAALLMHGVRNSIKLGSYQWFTNQGYICDSDNRTIFHKSLFASAFGGAAGAFVGSPLYQITTQLQSNAGKGIAVKGLWRGSNANVIRTVVGASAQLTTFSEAKDTLRQYDFFQRSTTMTAFFASIAGGICQTVFQTPLDLVCVRLNNQYVYANGQGALYTGMTNCLTKIIQSEGFFGLYKGVGVNYMRIARQTGFCLMFWELLKDLHVKYFVLNKNGNCKTSISDEIIKL